MHAFPRLTVSRSTLTLLALALLLSALAPSWAQAQTAFFFPSKTVCGYQDGNVPLLSNPDRDINPDYEQVKPGNYATTFNVFNYNINNQTENVSFYFSAPGGAPLIPLATIAMGDLTTVQFGCPDIAAAVGNPLLGRFFEGYLIIVVPNSSFKVSGVYSFESQNAFGMDNLGQVPDVPTGAGGLGLGASIDVEWMKLIKIDLSGQPNPMPNPIAGHIAVDGP